MERDDSVKTRESQCVEVQTLIQQQRAQLQQEAQVGVYFVVLCSLL